MSYLGVGVSPGNVPVSHYTVYSKTFDRRVRIAEFILRWVICGLGVVSAVLVGTDSEVKEIFSIRKTARFTDMKALVVLVITNGMVAAYSFGQGLKCVVTMLRGDLLFSKPLAWATFTCDQEHSKMALFTKWQLVAYVMVGAVAAAAQSAVIAKEGQAELQWMKICGMYDKFCNQVGEGIGGAALVGLSMLLLSSISAFTLFRLYGPNKPNRSLTL